jgi:NADH-quinone oxidoreductase subunit E
VPTFRHNEHVLAGFLDGHVNEGPSAGEASTLGLGIADGNGWTAPVPAEGPAGAGAGETASPSSTTKEGEK